MEGNASASLKTSKVKYHRDSKSSFLREHGGIFPLFKIFFDLKFPWFAGLPKNSLRFDLARHFQIY